MSSMKSRRGSTLVLVALMFVSLMAAGAIAADIGRFYVITSELQTAADAAALAGGLALQGTQGSSPKATIDAAVIQFVRTTNRSDGDTMTVTSDSIKLAYYDPTTSKVDYVLNGRRPNAVDVTLAGAPRGVFSQVIGRAANLPLTRHGVAWLANINSNCVKGMALPYVSLYNQVAGATGTAEPAPALDPVQFAAYEAKPVNQRTFQLNGPRQLTSGMSAAQLAANDGDWRGVEFVGNNGKPDFISYMTSCKESGLSAVNVKALSGIKAWQWTGEGLTPICNFNPNGLDAGCYQDAARTKLGLQINVVWADDASGNGAFGPGFRYVGRFTLNCYFMSSSQTCAGGKPGVPTLGLPQGTMIGSMASLGSTDITPDDVLSNTISNVQRVVLVR